MIASDYPITFPYGATTYPYGPTGYAGPYHRGDDRYMPVGTPVLINGVQIGLSGQSGEVTGPHLHIGRFVGGKDTNPRGLGFSVTGGVVSEVSSNPTDGNFVRVADADGSSWVYLHLSAQSVKVGTKLVGGAMFNLTKEEIMAISRFATGEYPGDNFNWGKYTGPPASQALVDELIQEFAPYSEKRIQEYQSLQEQVASGSSNATLLKPGTYQVK